MSANDALVIELKKAAEGLLYPSESDEPFEVMSWRREGNETAEEAVLRHCSEPSEIVSVDEFFNDLSESDDAERFKLLHALIMQETTNPKVVRVGRINIDVFIVGMANDNWVGVRTISVET